MKDPPGHGPGVSATNPGEQLSSTQEGRSTVSPPRPPLYPRPPEPPSQVQLQDLQVRHPSQVRTIPCVPQMSVGVACRAGHPQQRQRRGWGGGLVLLHTHYSERQKRASARWQNVHNTVQARARQGTVIHTGPPKADCAPCPPPAPLGSRPFGPQVQPQLPGRRAVELVGGRARETCRSCSRRVGRGRTPVMCAVRLTCVRGF